MPTITPVRLLRPRLTSLLNGWRKAPTRQRFAYAAFGGFGLVFWALLFFAMTVGVDAFYQVEIFGPIIIRHLLELLLVALFGMLVFSNIITALSTFYLSEDLELLLSLPVAPHTFFYTRLLDALAQSSWMMLMFGLPVFLAFGIAADAGPAYYASLLVVIPAYMFIPAAFGATVASLLVTLFPARRTKELLALVGILFLVGLFILLRVMQPERLLDAQDFEWVAAYVANLDAPVPLFLPPAWAAELLSASLQGRPYPWMELGLLVTGSVGITGASRWVTQALYADGWTRSQEARGARLAKAGLFHRVLTLLTRPFHPQQAALLVKDAKVFVRDPAQWSQVFLLGALIVIYLFSVRAFPTDFVKGPYLQGLKNILAFLNLGMVGFVMAAIAVRFQYAAISGEGRAFWLIRTAPIRPERYLWTKAVPGLIPMVLVGEVLAVVSSSILGVPDTLLVVSAIAALGLAVAISGVAVGMGATYPDFKADNIAKAASGPGAMVFMVAALVLVVAVVSLEAIPAFYLMKADFEGSHLSGRQLLISGLLHAAAAGVCAVGAIWPVRQASAGLWARNL